MDRKVVLMDMGNESKELLVLWIGEVKAWR